MGGTCEARGMFPINSTSVCRAAAKVLGFSWAPAPVSMRTKTQECYVMRNMNEWMAANGIAKSRETAETLKATSRVESVPQKRRAKLQSHSGMETLCSSQAYPPEFNDYLDSAMVSKRIRQVEWSLADSRSLCPDPKVQCSVLWPLTVQVLTQLGLGQTIRQFESLRAYVEYNGCKFVVSEALVADWHTHRLGPFWSVTLPEQQWQARWNAATMCGFQKLPVKCEGPQGFLSQAGLNQFVTRPAFNSGVFRAAYDLTLQTFGPRLAQYRTPYNGRYAAIHAAYHEGMPERELVELVRSWWPSMERIFVSTMYKSVIYDLKSSFGGGIELSWTRNLKGWDHEVTVEPEVATLLDDIAGLASASVIVGRCSSPVFNLARTLNLHLHSRVARSNPWCYDLEMRRVCG